MDAVPAELLDSEAAYGKVAVRIHLAADTVVDGRHVAVCTDALNNYLVVRTRRGETVDAFALDDALAVLGCVSPLVDWLPASGPIVATPGGAVHVPRLHAAAYGRVDVEYPEIIASIAPA